MPTPLCFQLCFYYQPPHYHGCSVWAATWPLRVLVLQFLLSAGGLQAGTASAGALSVMGSFPEQRRPQVSCPSAPPIRYRMGQFFFYSEGILAWPWSVNF